MISADPARDGIRCMLMRGGTSKGAYFLPEDLPADARERDELLLRIVGSPDPRQIDGIGGAHPLTSKVAIVTRSAEPGVDLDYLFLQLGVDEPTVSAAQTCGNLLAGVGPFGLERGLITAEAGVAAVRIRLLNTGDVATARFAIAADGRVEYDGDAAIDGVPGTAGAVEIEMDGGKAKPVLPTGNLVDLLDGHEATLVDNGMPVVLLRAADFGVTGDEPPAELEARPGLHDAVERVRLAAGPLFGIEDVAGKTVPKMFLLSAPRHGGAVSTRAFIPARVHPSIGVLMAASVAAGIRIPGTVGSELARIPEGDAVPIEHPSGTFGALVRVGRNGEDWVSTYSANLRTARKLFDGVVYARPRL